MGYSCCKESDVAKSSFSEAERQCKGNESPFVCDSLPVDRDEREEVLQQKQQESSAAQKLPPLMVRKATLTRTTIPPLHSFLSPTHSTPVTRCGSQVDHPLSGSFRWELSDTILCSSTTVEDTWADSAGFHRRVETTASSTLPELSMPTASLCFDHPRTVSDSDSEVDYSPVERSTATLHERCLMTRVRERERVVAREILALENEKRYAVVKFFNSSYRIIAIRYYRGLWTLTRRQIIRTYLGERYKLLVCSLEMQEFMQRRLIEHECQIRLLRRMQKLRFNRMKQKKYELAAANVIVAASPMGKLPGAPLIH